MSTALRHKFARKSWWPRLQDAGMRPGEIDHKETIRLASEAMRGMPP